jgi:GNAT superfamily N-acetyltransferase
VATNFEPFAPDHLDAAATLLAARHGRDRKLFPDLPARYEDPGEMRPLLAASLEAPSSSGVVALQDGRLIGHLLAEMQLTGTLRLMPPRSMFIGYTGHSVDPTEDVETYRQLYAAIAPRWVEAGSFAHYIEVPADDALPRAWLSLGFGQVMTCGLRDTRPADHARRPTDVEIAQAGAEDLDVVTQLEGDNLRYHAGSPMFVPWMDEAEPDLRAYLQEELSNTESAFFLARHEGHDGGIVTLHPGGSNPTRPDNSVHLQHGYTEARLRGGGVGTVLLDHGLAWARERGATSCTVNWFSANLLAARFWTGSGFRATRYRLARHIDQRIAWAGSDANA